MVVRVRPIRYIYISISNTFAFSIVSELRLKTPQTASQSSAARRNDDFQAIGCVAVAVWLCGCVAGAVWDMEGEAIVETDPKTFNFSYPSVTP